MAVRTEKQLDGGELTFDPSENVKALSNAANQRQDDLRRETNLRIDAELRCLKEVANLRDGHSKEIGDMREKSQQTLRRAEAERLDSIRQVDREDVNKTAAQALNAIATLAATTTTTAETLRTQVATTAQAQANALANTMGEVNKRLSALELSSSEGRGKQTVSDPALAALVAEVRALRTTDSTATGQSQGQKSIVTYISIGISILLGLLLLADRFGK